MLYEFCIREYFLWWSCFNFLFRFESWLHHREDNYVYIDDDGQGARFQYGGHGTGSASSGHERSDAEEKNLLERCQWDEAHSQNLAGMSEPVACSRRGQARTQFNTRSVESRYASSAVLTSL